MSASRTLRVLIVTLAAFVVACGAGAKRGSARPELPTPDRNLDKHLADVGHIKTFDNGLTLFVLPDPYTRLVQFDVRHHVGSREDPPGKAGMAHFVEHLMFQLPADGPDYVLVRLDFVGRENAEIKNLRYDIVDKQDEVTGLSAMMRTTAFPASIIAQMMARGDVMERGATPQEKAIESEDFVAELARRNIEIVEVWH